MRPNTNCPGESIKSVESFTYLGSKINSTEKDMKIHIAKAWAVLNKMDEIWKSALPDNLWQRFL